MESGGCVGITWFYWSSIWWAAASWCKWLSNSVAGLPLSSQTPQGCASDGQGEGGGILPDFIRAVFDVLLRVDVDDSLILWQDFLCHLRPRRVVHLMDRGMGGEGYYLILLEQYLMGCCELMKMTLSFCARTSSVISDLEGLCIWWTGKGGGGGNLDYLILLEQYLMGCCQLK